MRKEDRKSMGLRLLFAPLPQVLQMARVGISNTEHAKLNDRTFVEHRPPPPTFSSEAEFNLSLTHSILYFLFMEKIFIQNHCELL